MRIIGFSLTKILIERKEELEGQLKISQNININDIKKQKIPISNEEALKITFNFVIEYSENSGKLNFEGYTILLPETKKMKEILKSWKDKQISEELRVPLFNFIMNKCNIRALDLEDELGLPPHVPMPRIQPGQNPNK